MVRKNLSGNSFGINPEKVIISATHPHTGPVYSRGERAVSGGSAKEQLEKFLKNGREYVEKQQISNNDDIISPDEMLELLCEKITQVVIDAWTKKAPASFSNAFGRAPVGMCRRVSYTDGSAQMWGETNQAVFTALEGGSDTGIKEGNVDYNDAAKLQRYLGILTRLEVQNVVNLLDTEVHIVKLGTIAIATNPFELFLDYGNQIKARSKAEQTFLIQLACAAEGYLPTKKAEIGGHYSAFISSGIVGHEGGDLLVRNTLDEINKMF